MSYETYRKFTLYVLEYWNAVVSHWLSNFVSFHHTCKVKYHQNVFVQLFEAGEGQQKILRNCR